VRHVCKVYADVDKACLDETRLVSAVRFWTEYRDGKGTERERPITRSVSSCQAQSVGVARRRQNRTNFKAESIKALEYAKKRFERTTAVLIVRVPNRGVGFDRSSHAM
jgi:hypothetical protein